MARLATDASKTRKLASEILLTCRRAALARGAGTGCEGGSAHDEYAEQVVEHPGEPGLLALAHDGAEPAAEGAVELRVLHARLATAHTTRHELPGAGGRGNFVVGWVVVCGCGMGWEGRVGTVSTRKVNDSSSASTWSNLWMWRGPTRCLETMNAAPCVGRAPVSDTWQRVSQRSKARPRTLSMCSTDRIRFSSPAGSWATGSSPSAAASPPLPAACAPALDLIEERAWPPCSLATCSLAQRQPEGRSSTDR